MKTEFIPIDFDYFDYEGKNFIKLIGRMRSGEQICVVDSYEPNFWVILKNEYIDKADEVAKKIKDLKVKKADRTTEILKTEIYKKKFLGKDVVAIRVFVTNHKDAHDVASAIGDMKEIEGRREYDISILTKYIKEKGIEPLCWYTVEGNELGKDDFNGVLKLSRVKNCILASKIKKEKDREMFHPRVLAFDIEVSDTEIGKGEVLMISMYGENFKKVLTCKECKLKQDYVEFLDSEKKMLERFVECVNEYNPDILTGYFSDGFDLPYLKAVCRRHKVKMAIGLDGSEPYFARGRIPSGKISGIVHVDLYKFVSAVLSQYLQSETLSLREVAKELIGEEKGDFDFGRLIKMNESDWKDFFAYCLQDSRITFNLFEEIWPDIFEFARVIREPLFDITRDRMSSHVENYIIHNLDRFNEIAEKRPVYEEIEERKEKRKYGGAFVFEPVPGLYEKICVFDFTSMHASIIVSFNISRSTFREKKEKNVFETPEFILDEQKKKFYFTKKKEFFPELLSEVVELRKKFKAEYKKNPSALLKARSNTYKLLANASYGYLGFFGARYYCRECAASTLAFVREFTNKTMEEIKESGCKIIFSDTDSVGFVYNGKKKSEVLALLEKLNNDLPGIMELELEDFYSRGIFVSKRTGRASPSLPLAKRTSLTGAKKKYALLDEKGKIKIRGFETVRRDWCRYTRDLQSQILKNILEDGNEKSALKILKEKVSKLKKREVDVKELMVTTQLRRDIEKYVSEGPHVAAAKKMREKNIPVSEGSFIEYYIGENKNKTKKIGDRVCLPDDKTNYDIDYYLDNQVFPSVENIFDVFGISAKEVVEGEKQNKLF